MSPARGAPAVWMPEKPSSLHDREAEWADLADFMRAPGPRLRLGIVYGRRRYGKSFLLRRLVEAADGIYHLALQEERRAALHRFARTLSRAQPGTPPLSLDDWYESLAYAVDVLGSRSTGPQLLVLDEYPYLSQASPELDSAVQALMDESAAGGLGARWEAEVGIVVCGSAMSVMTDVLAGTSPMRGRATLDMPLTPFDYRQSREFWDIGDLDTAFAVDAIVGGAAGYRDLTAAAGTPQQPDELGEWLAATLLNPSHALFREDEYLLREDPRVTVEAPYYSLLAAISAGRASQGRIAEAVGRAPGDIVHHLNVMTTAGFIVRSDDLLTRRRPAYRIADPIVRFHHMVTRRRRALLEDRRAHEAWADAADTYRSNVIGPHLEVLCRRWVRRYAGQATLGGPIGATGRAQVHDRARRTSFELDVIAARPDSAADSTQRHTVIGVLGESKARQMDDNDLARLDRIAELLNQRQHVTVPADAKRLLFSPQGFNPNLTSTANQRPEVELIGLDRLYNGR